MEVCGNQELHEILDLGQHPMCDDLVPIGNMRSCKQYPIEILFAPIARLPINDSKFQKKSFSHQIIIIGHVSLQMSWME